MASLQGFRCEFPAQEQEIILAEQGILAREQGILSARIEIIAEEAARVGDGEEIAEMA